VNIDLINHIAATIRRVDGGHTMGAGALAEAIVADLGKLANNDEVLTLTVNALVANGWGARDDEDMARIARTVLRALAEG
jgi:hypothetical protein